MALIICHETSVRRYENAAAKGWDDADPDLVAFKHPPEAHKGDRMLLFVGGRLNLFVGYGSIESNWKVGRSGKWRGVDYIFDHSKILKQPIPAQDVLLATGFPIPKGCRVVPEKLANQVWKAARGRPLIGVERAMEGATTEARSKYRNPQLRQAALQLANGKCAACGIRDSQIHPQLGRHALVVHHKKQLKDSDQPRETKISDLAVVCANCHMMIHQDSAKALTIAQMRKRLVSPK